MLTDDHYHDQSMVIFAYKSSDVNYFKKGKAHKKKQSSDSVGSKNSVKKRVSDSPTVSKFVRSATKRLTGHSTTNMMTFSKNKLEGRILTRNWKQNL